MHIFNYEHVNIKIDNELLDIITQINERKGEQNMYLNFKSVTLAMLLETAKIQSVEASNQIEGIDTGDDRLRQLVLDKTLPHSNNEKKIAGYRNALKMIYNNYNYILTKPSYILQLHQELYSFSEKDMGGKYKSADNVALSKTESGDKIAGVKQAEWWSVSDSLEAACNSFCEAAEQQSVNILLLIPMFILDFLCIYPFADGNGQMSRLLTLLLLYRAGFNVGKYISIEKIILQTEEEYYDALLQSSYGWNDNKNNYMPFIKYMLRVCLSAYIEFNDKVQIWNTKTISKSQRIADIIKNKSDAVTKTEIKGQCPDISEITVQRTLAYLVESGYIVKIGGGRYTKYIWKKDKK